MTSYFGLGHGFFPNFARKSWLASSQCQKTQVFGHAPLDQEAREAGRLLCYDLYMLASIIPIDVMCGLCSVVIFIYIYMSLFIALHCKIHAPLHMETDGTAHCCLIDCSGFFFCTAQLPESEVSKLKDFQSTATTQSCNSHGN